MQFEVCTAEIQPMGSKVETIIGGGGCSGVGLRKPCRSHMAQTTDTIPNNAFNR